MSRVRVSLRPSNFFYTRKTSKTSGKSGRQRVCVFEWSATGIVASGADLHGRAPPNSDSLYGDDGGDGGVCAQPCPSVKRRRGGLVLDGDGLTTTGRILQNMN